MSQVLIQTLLVFGGIIAGFIDSVAGGGGLITLPLLILALGNPVEAIATNKIVGTVGALIALLVYRRAGHLDWRKGVVFTAWVTLGSLLGSSSTPWIPEQALRWLIVAICPIILWIIWKKDAFVLTQAASQTQSPPLQLALAGLACGFYDGAFGPGGGTFMFLGLLYVVKLPLLSAMAVTKLSNTFSAGMALTRFSFGGHVHWSLGALMACGMAFGAFFGARIATVQSARILKPVLTVVVILLLLKLAFR